jgi:hypothetical protein
MAFDRIKEDITDTLIYRMAERILCDALEHGARSINMRCHPKEKDAFLDAAAAGTAQDSPGKRGCLDGRGDYELGFFLSGIRDDVPYRTMPVIYFLPLLNILSSEKTAHQGKQCFAVYREDACRKAVDKYFEVTLYLERDSSITIDIEQIT